jgi:hypothetical protein
VLILEFLDRRWKSQGLPVFTAVLSYDGHLEMSHELTDYEAIRLVKVQ